MKDYRFFSQRWFLADNICDKTETEIKMTQSCLAYSAGSFATQFSDPLVQDFPECISFDIDGLETFTVVHEKVLCILRTLNVHKACGPDRLSARILYECANEFAVPLMKLCALSFSQEPITYYYIEGT